METRQFGEFLMLLGKLPEGASADGELLKHYANLRIEQIIKSFPWTRLQRTAIIETVAKYDTGTVTIVSGATTGVGVGTTFTVDMNGRRVRIAETSAFYIFGFVDALNFTIDRPYEDATNVAAGGFRIWQPIYSLPPDVGRLKSLNVPTRRWNIDEKNRQWLDRMDSGRAFYGDPQAYVFYSDADSQQQPQIELYPGTENKEGLTVEYEAKFMPMLKEMDLFPDWFSIAALWAGCVSDLNGRPMDKEALFENELKIMQGEDTRRKPPLEIPLADRYVQHRVERALKSSRGRGFWRQW